MRFPGFVLVILLAATIAVSQESPAPEPNAPAAKAANTIVIPGGSRVPLVLKHAVTTKSARVGDGIYLQTSFPFTVNDKIVIPPGTYVQGVIDEIKRPGRLKGRAQVLFHFTTLIFPNGYTVTIPGSVESVPGMENSKVKDKEGTVEAEGQKGQDAATVAGATGTGAVVGALSRGAKGAGIGAGIGAVAGLATVLFTRGNDIRMEAGSTVEMYFNRALVLDEDRLHGRTSQSAAVNEAPPAKRPVLVPAPE